MTKSAQKPNKTQETEQSVAAFVAQIPDPQRQADSAKLLEWFQEWTQLPPKMWGNAIVGFGSYHYQYESGRSGDSLLVGFSPRAGNMSVYLTSDLPGRAQLLQRLGKHKMGKACLNIQKLSDIDPDILRQLVQGSLAHRRENHQAGC